MSVIDTLFFVFKGDTRDAEQALDRTSKKADKAEGAIGQLVKKGAATLGGALAFGMLAMKVGETADQMNSLAEASDRMGLDVGELDAWSRAIEDAGGSAESFMGSLKGLNSNIQMIKVKGKSRALPFLEELGFTKSALADTKDVMQLLPELADKLSQLDAQEAIGFGEKLGIDEATIGVLMQGRKATEEMVAAQKKLGVMSDEDKKKVKEYDDAMDNLGRTFQQIWRTLTMLVIPTVQKLADLFTSSMQFLKEHKHLVEGVGIVFAVVIGGLAVAAVYSFISALTVWRVVALGAAAANALMLAPMYLMIALVAALAAAFVVLYEDFRVWTEGGDSFLGDHLGTWKEFKESIIGWIDEILLKWDNLKQLFSDMGGNLLKLVTGEGIDLDAMSEGAAQAGGDIRDAGYALEIGKQQTGIADGSSFNALPARMGGSVKTNNTSVQTGSVTINTQATDGEGVAASFSGWLEKHLKDATAGTDDGVEA